MAITNQNIPGLHLPNWSILSGVAVTGLGAGGAWTFDMRNIKHGYNCPMFYYMASITSVQSYNPRMDGPSTSVVNPSLGGSIAAGSSAIFVPSAGVKGTLAAGATNTRITPSATLGATVGLNQLSARGDGKGYIIRIIDNGAGGTGKTEERFIIDNTFSATPLITLGTALSFVPVTGSAFEMLSGKIFMLAAGTTAAGFFKSYDPAINFMSGNLSIVNLPATIGTDTNFLSLDEQYVPRTAKPGEGFITGASTYGTNVNGVALSCLLATGSALGTITGQAVAGDATVVANQYRNYQIRIVEDATTPTAAGQRRVITSHTAGPSSVYTLATNWSVTPSANAKFVIEYPNYLLAFTSASTSTFSYAYQTTGAQAADTWSTATFAASASSPSTGSMSMIPFGITVDSNRNVTPSKIFRLRGGGAINLDILDISAGATGVWTNSATYGSMSSVAPSTGSCGVYDPYSFAGEYFYFNLSGSQYFYRFDIQAGVIDPITYLKYAQSTAVVGQRMCLTQTYDGTSSQVNKLFLMRGSGTEMANLILSNE